jgi:predicted nucleic acid-binding protein
LRFWDASALVPLCVQQPATTQVRPLLEEVRDLAVWWGSPVECWSALARLRREGRLSVEGEETARARLDDLRLAWTEILPSEAVRELAGRIIRTHLLRAADGLQLAAALVWAGSPPAGSMVVLDQRLADAARLEGLDALPSS